MGGRAVEDLQLVGPENRFSGTADSERYSARTITHDSSSGIIVESRAHTYSVQSKHTLAGES